MNNMQGICNLFGVSLNEWFYIKELGKGLLFKFTGEGLKSKTPTGDTAKMLERLIMGDYTLMKLSPSPAKGDKYWYVDYTGEVKLGEFEQSLFTLYLIKYDNYFTNKGDAIKKVEDNATTISFMLESTGMVWDNAYKYEPKCPF